MRQYILAAAAAMPVMASAQAQWIKIAETEDMVWDFQQGSAVLSKNKGNKPIIVAMGRTFNRKTGTYEFNKAYVLIEDCAARAGKLVTLKLQGDFWYETDFVRGGGTIASSLAELLCDVAEKQRKENDEKGI